MITRRIVKSLETAAKQYKIFEWYSSKPEGQLREKCFETE